MKQTFFLYYFSLLCLASFAAPSALAEHYAIDKDQSYIHVLTGRAGLLKMFSHRHVVELGPLKGTFDYEENALSTATLELKPAQFFVDRPAKTAMYPEIWDTAVNDSAAKGTKKNMLSSKLLDAETFPNIDVNIQLAPNTANQPIFHVAVHIKDGVFALDIPGTLEQQGDNLLATAEFSLSHGQLGLTPFSAAGGMFAVADEMTFIVHIVATP